MSAKRCDTCDVNFPASQGLDCPLCGRKTEWLGDPAEADRGWQKLVDAANPPLDLPPSVHPDRLAEFAGQMWIHDRSLTLTGYDNPQAGTIIRVNRGMMDSVDIYFELMGRARQVGIGPDHPRHEDGWWIKRVDPEAEFKDLELTGLEDGR